MTADPHLDRLDNIFTNSFKRFTADQHEARLFSADEWINGTVNSIVRLLNRRKPELTWDVVRVNYGEGWNIVGTADHLRVGKERTYLKAEKD